MLVKTEGKAQNKISCTENLAPVDSWPNWDPRSGSRTQSAVNVSARLGFSPQDLGPPQ